MNTRVPTQNDDVTLLKNNSIWVHINDVKM